MTAGSTVAFGPASALSDALAMQQRPEYEQARSAAPPSAAPPSAAQSAADADYQKAIREILKLLPEDVIDELNRGETDVNDPAFLEGLTDHVSRQALADPVKGRRLLGKLTKLKKSIARGVRASHPEVSVSSTVTGISSHRIGRNAPCPCGSGKKFKQCCLHKQNRAAQ